MVQSSPPRQASINIYKYLLSLNVLYSLWIANKKTKVINIIAFQKNAKFWVPWVESYPWFAKLEIVLKRWDRSGLQTGKRRQWLMTKTCTWWAPVCPLRFISPSDDGQRGLLGIPPAPVWLTFQTWTLDQYLMVIKTQCRQI